MNGEIVLSADVARRMTDEVKADAATLWAKLVTLYEGQAHTALGYASWGAYYAAEFGESRTRGYELLSAGRVMQALGQSDMSDWLPANDRQAKELAPLIDRPEELRAAWADAQEVAAERGQPVTAAVIRDVVRGHIKGMAAESQAEMDAATAHYSPELRAALTPESLRQRGEFKRLCRDLADIAGGEPDAFVMRHREYIDSIALADANRAFNWLAGFLTAIDAEAAA